MLSVKVRLVGKLPLLPMLNSCVSLKNVCICVLVILGGTMASSLFLVLVSLLA